MGQTGTPSLMALRRFLRVDTFIRDWEDHIVCWDTAISAGEATTPLTAYLIPQSSDHISTFFVFVTLWYKAIISCSILWI